MSRQIKFRVWIGVDRRMCYGFRINAKTGNYCWVSNGGIWHDCEEYPVMQFTGLKDVNGREIYEGDIISHAFKDDKKTIALYQLIQWELLPAGDCMDMESYGYHINPHWGGQYEVVGNIYQNPELVKKCGA